MVFVWQNKVSLSRYVDLLYRDLLGRTPSDAECTNGIAGVNRAKNRAGYVATLINSWECRQFVIVGLSKAPLVGSFIEPSLALTDNRGADAENLSIINLATSYFSSPAYFSAANESNSEWLDRIYQRLLGRHPDPQGMLFHLSTLASKVTTREAVSKNVFCSPEAHTQRANAVYQRLLGRKPLKGEFKTPTKQTTDDDIIELICSVATSDEYRQRIDT